MTAFGQKLRQLREDRHISITVLSQATGLSRSSIYTWETGEKMPMKRASSERRLPTCVGGSKEMIWHSHRSCFACSFGKLEEMLAMQGIYIFIFVTCLGYGLLYKPVVFAPFLLATISFAAMRYQWAKKFFVWMLLLILIANAYLYFFEPACYHDAEQQLSNLLTNKQQVNFQ